MQRLAMDPRRTFGRRAALQPAILAPAPLAPAPPVEPLLSQPALPTSSVEDEIAAWKASRGAVVPFPWRQLSLMAGLCFGIASFVLPESINDTLQWPLYALAAVSFYMGLHKRSCLATPSGLRIASAATATLHVERPTQRRL